MLTLKVSSVDLNGQVEVTILTGESITHKEYFSKDHNLRAKIKENTPHWWIVGNIMDTSGESPFVVSEVRIYDGERYCINELFIFPKADCYIMENGKTVDTFSCNFQQ